MDVLIFSEFVFICLAFIISPGPSIMVAVSHAISYGGKASRVTALGDISANFLQMMIVLIGVFLFYDKFETSTQWIMWVGVVYLWYLTCTRFYGLVTRKNKSPIQINAPIAESGASVAERSCKGQCFKEGFLVAALNPKAFILFGSILPQYIVREQHHLIASPIYVLTMLAMDYMVVVAYAYLAARMVSKMKNIFIIEAISFAVLLVVVVRITLRNIQVA